MNKLWALILFSSISVFSYGQNWVNSFVPQDLDQTCLIVEKLDSVGPKCHNGKKAVYCNDFDKGTDKQLSSYQKQQEIIFQQYKHEYILVLPKAFPYQEFSDFKDINKYRYILKIHTFVPQDGKQSNYTWLYYFYDRKTHKAFPRIHHIADNRFKSLKELVTQINAKFDVAEKK